MRTLLDPNLRTMQCKKGKFDIPMITRTPFLTALPVNGSFRYRDTLQIISSRKADPHPPFQQGWYGGTLAVSFEESTADVRNSDYWAHDHRERIRFDKLKSQTNDKDWLSAVIFELSMKRRRGIEKEALNLLQVISNNIFRTPSTEHDWFLDPKTQEAIYGQGWHPSFVTDDWGSFLDESENLIKLIDPKSHYGRGTGVEERAITLPSNILELLDTYFGLPPSRKISFERACNLFRSAQTIWSTSRSLALAAYVFAIDALCHADEPKPKKCTSCENLQSDQVCEICGGPKFGLTRRFREFVSQYVHDPEEKELSEALFSVRSEIAHRGELLPMDEYGTEFGRGTDQQNYFSYGVGQTTRRVLLGWLSNAKV